ncbi:MAG: hypothetical protein QM820_55895 [Minicystis sp.]
MGNVDHDLLLRLLTRSEEVAAEPGMKPTVVLVYQDVLKKPAQAYQAATSQAKDADTIYVEKTRDAAKALDAMDAPYREARSVVGAYLPMLAVPATLKSQPTDTEQRGAIKDLRAEIEKRGGEAWATELLNGAFGQLAPVTIAALDASIAAGKVSATARQQRAAAFDPAYASFLRFKQVVRDALGPKSKQYQRLRVHRKGTAEPTDDAPQPPASPSPKPTGTGNATIGGTTLVTATPASSTPASSTPASSTPTSSTPTSGTPS